MRNPMVIPDNVAAEATHPTVAEAVEQRSLWRGARSEIEIDSHKLTDEVLADLIAASATSGNKSFGRVVSAIAFGRAGDFKPIPKFAAAAEMLLAYLRYGLIDGWVYERTESGGLRPYLITSISVFPGSQPRDPDTISIQGVFNSIFEDEGSRRGGSLNRESWSLESGSLTRKTPEAVFDGLGLMHETPELKAEYEEHVEDYRQVLTGGFAQQYRYTGTPLRSGSSRWSRPNPRVNAKVVHDVAPGEIASLSDTYASSLVGDGESKHSDEVLPVPIHFDLRVFDLGTHEFVIVDTRGMTPYVYDHALRDKLVLPVEQRDLLDILTNDITTFTADMIEGKSAGNVILCKGRPGVGKTLSAEVYAELTERPLYSIHSGSLGTKAESVRENLEKVFTRSQRWDAVLLLDEADVFVIERGDNLEQNAIVAEFLRTMEYFTGLMFMTTNRPDSVDEAILSRCAAIIDYQVPGREDARKIWHVLAGLSNTTLPEDLVDALLDGFPEIAPRDVKMLLRLTLRVAQSKGVPLSVDVFRQCAMFRGLHFRNVKHPV